MFPMQTSRPKVAKMVTKHAILVKEVEQVRIRIHVHTCNMFTCNYVFTGNSVCITHYS